MSHSHEHNHEHAHEGANHHDHPQKQSRKLHKDWRLWMAVLLMVGLIVYYLASLDFFR